MSKRTEAFASTATSAISTAGNLAVELAIKDIPSLGETPSAAEAESWNEIAQRCAGDNREYEGKSRLAAQQTLAMVVMLSQLYPYSYWETKLREAGLGLPKNKDTLTYALAYILKLDVGNVDKKKASDHSKALNRYTSAGRSLLAAAGEKFGRRGGKVMFAYDPTCVQELVSMVIVNGGINKMALAEVDEFGVKDQLIKLSPEAHGFRQEKLLEKTLASESEIVVALATRLEGNAVKVTQQLDLPPEVLAHLYPQLKLADPRVRFLAELFTVGEAVTEERTAHLQNPETDDPNDPGSPRRLASRQFVFHPGGEMTISPILSDSSVVVSVKPKIDLLGIEVEGHVRFQTFGRRRAAINIADPKRQDAFDFEMVDAGETEGVARIRLTTSVAKAEDDKAKDVGMLIEHVRSRQGNYPLVVASSFAPVAVVSTVSDLIDKMGMVASKAKDLMKNKVPVVFQISNDRLTVNEFKPGQTSSTGMDAIRVRPDDFLAVSKALASVKAIDGFGVEVDRDMIVISFATEFAEYRIHIPAALGEMVRSNRHIATLSPVEWSKSGEGTEASETSDEGNTAPERKSRRAAV